MVHTRLPGPAWAVNVKIYASSLWTANWMSPGGILELSEKTRGKRGRRRKKKKEDSRDPSSARGRLGGV